MLQRRGPDFQDSASVTLEDGRLLYFSGTVLHMRGQLCAQPISQPDSNNILLWNGEIFSGIEVMTCHIGYCLSVLDTTPKSKQGGLSLVGTPPPHLMVLLSHSDCHRSLCYGTSTLKVPPDQNDGKILFKLLSRCQNDREILHIFKKLNGPYAFVFYQVW